MRAIFVSYRRNDSEGEAGRLFDDLVKQFGEASVFMDVTAIDMGRDFRQAIEQSVATCGVLLAIIGRDWIDARNEAGKRRLDDPHDFVRLETASALKRDIPVIPILVRGARMPLAEELPDDLKELAYRNCVELTHARWVSDVQLLIKGLRSYLEHPAKSTDPAILGEVSNLSSRSSAQNENNPNINDTEPRNLWWKTRGAIFALLLTVIVAAVIAGYALWPRQTTVPDLTGGTLADAALKLKAAHLKVGNETYQQNAQSEPGTILKQLPSANSRVQSGMGIDLTLSQHPATVQVPTLMGGSLRVAEETLQGGQLKLGNISRQTRPDVAKNTVLDQFPKPGESIAIGSQIDLSVSEEPVNPPAQRVVPNPPPAIAAQPGGGGGANPGRPNQGPQMSVSVIISSVVCSVISPGTFRIQMAGRISVPVGQTYLFYTEESGAKGGTRWRPQCQSWAAAGPSDGVLYDASCVHRPNDPAETAWMATMTLKPQDGQPPTQVYAGTIIPGGGKAGGADRSLTCVH